MKKSTYFLIMAVVWTVVAVAVVALVSRTGTGSFSNMVLLLFAFIAVAGNWLRWYRSR
jgi:uncharacterized membrane protein